MRIVVLGPLPPIRGGIAAHTEGLVAALRGHGNEVHVVAYGRLYPRWATGARPGSTPRSMAGQREDDIDFLAPRAWRRVAAKIRAFAPDVVLTQYWTPISAVAIGSVLARVGTATRIVVCHNIVPHERIPGARIAARRILARCDGAIFHSRHVARQARELGIAVPHRIAALPLLVGAGSGPSRPPPELRADCAAGARISCARGICGDTRAWVFWPLHGVAPAGSTTMSCWWSPASRWALDAKSRRFVGSEVRCA
jgi:glycosyltransferase involved in cell wall biosynthesis